MNLKRRIAASLAAIALLVGLGVAPANGYALTSVKNIGTSLIRVQLDNGTQRYINPQETVWGVSWLIPNATIVAGKPPVPHCIDYNPGGAVCYPAQYKLPLGQYTARIYR